MQRPCRWWQVHRMPLQSTERIAVYEKRRTLHQPGQLAATVMWREVRWGSSASSLVPCSTAAFVMLYSRNMTSRLVRGAVICRAAMART